jgi:hypothetical protein
MAKFMLLQNYEAGAGCDMPMTEWVLEDIKSHIAFQEALTAELAANGEVAGEYLVQALIAAAHDGADSVVDTDWAQILSLYGLLERMTGNPMVALNRAVVAAMVHGPAAGLKLLEPLDGPLAGHCRLDAVRAHLLEMAGDPQAAVTHYPGRGGAHDEHPGAPVPHRSGRPAQGGGAGPSAQSGLTCTIEPSRTGTSPLP